MEESLSNKIQRHSGSLPEELSKMPSATRRRFLKAFKQLCFDSVDIPSSWLLEQVSKLKRTSEDRESTIPNVKTEIDDDPVGNIDFNLRSSAQFVSKIFREQANLDAVISVAAQELASDMSEHSSSLEEQQQESSKEIDDEWLNEFEDQARNKSSEEMRMIFSKILSGEVSKPGSFSIKTIKLVSQLDSNVARLFQTLCSNSISFQVKGSIIDVRVVGLKGSPASNSLSQFGLSFGELNILQEYGLIISDFNSFMDYMPALMNESLELSLPFTFDNKLHAFVFIDAEKPLSDLKMNGVALTQAGKELFKIMTIEANVNYKNALFEFFQSRNLEVVEVE